MNLRLRLFFKKQGLKLIIKKSRYQKLYNSFSKYFIKKNGIEIGGPSYIFKEKYLNIYSDCDNMSNVNFSDKTVWSGQYKNEEFLTTCKRFIQEFIHEGTDLNSIKDDQYDFLLSSHNIEHISNPIKALIEWKRIIKKEGIILLIIPSRNFAMDRFRDYTAFDHLMEDYKNNVSESDLTHVEEFLLNFDYKLFGSDFNNSEFRPKILNNSENRMMHHHVFSNELVYKMADFCEMKVLNSYFIEPFHDIYIIQKI